MFIAAGCSQAHEAAFRAEKETFCLKWRAVKEVAKHSDSPAALWALDKARSGLRGAVPEAQRANLDAVLRAARDFADQTDEKVGNLDENAVDLARREGARGLTKAVDNLNGYCKGSLTG